MTKITAAEAREIAGPCIEDHLAEAYAEIRKAAEDKRREARLHSEFWTREGYSRTRNWIEAVDVLTKDGFVVDFFYRELSIAVDMYTVVKW